MPFWLHLSFALPLLVVGGVARADVVSTTGDVVETTPPMSFRNDEWRDDRMIRLFTERTETLASPIDVRGVPASRVVTNDPAVDTALPTDVSLTSHYLHFDPVVTDHSTSPREGTVTFDGDIVGFAFVSDTLTTTGEAFALSLRYPTNASRGMETNSTDEWFEVTDLRTVRVSMRVGTSVDNLRVITLTAEPEPDAGVDAGPPLDSGVVLDSGSTDSGSTAGDTGAPPDRVTFTGGGGCGCTTAGRGPSHHSAGWLLGAFAGLAGWRLRRRSRRP